MPCIYGCDAVTLPAEVVEPPPVTCRTLVSRAATRALARVDLTSCETGGPWALVAIAEVTFDARGEVVAMRMVRHLPSLVTETCVASRVHDVHIPAFDGDDVVVTHAFVLR